MTHFINLTPHVIRLRVAQTDMEPIAREDDIVLPSVGVARVSATAGGLMGDADGVALYGATKFGEVENLPEPAPDTIYIVSGIVAGWVTGRDDVFGPGTGPNDKPVRKDGQIYAVTRLVQAG